MAENKQDNLTEATEPVVASPDVTEIGTEPVAVVSEASGAGAVETVTDASGENTASAEALSDRVRVISPFKLVIKRFFRSRLSVIGLTMFLAVLLFSFLGPVFVGWKEDEIDRSPQYRIEYTNEEHTAIGPDGKEYKYYTISFSQNQTLNSTNRVTTYSFV